MGESVFNRGLFFAASICVCLLCTTVSLAGKELKLVDDGRAMATIVLASKPSSSAQLAAFELQHYIEKISWARLPIVHEPDEVVGNLILIGDTEATRKLGYSNGSFVQTEYLIESRQDTLILTGLDVGSDDSFDYNGDLSLFARYFSQAPLGSCHVVHTFLENVLGVRWYLPGEIGAVFPEMKTIRVPTMKLRRKVDVPVRVVHPQAVNKKLHYSDYSTVKLHDEYFDLREGVLYWIRNKNWGGTRFNANHSFVAWDKLFGKEHPQWFSTKSWKK